MNLTASLLEDVVEMTTKHWFFSLVFITKCLPKVVLNNKRSKLNAILIMKLHFRENVFMASASFSEWPSAVYEVGLVFCLRCLG